jgi:hypothetical protein
METIYLTGIHMYSSNLVELHLFARRIGLSKSWYQSSPYPHYEVLCSHRWNKAYDYGAKYVKKFGKVE